MSLGELSGGGGESFDSDALAYIEANHIDDASAKTAINDFVTVLKAQGLWDDSAVLLGPSALAPIWGNEVQQLGGWGVNAVSLTSIESEVEGLYYDGSSSIATVELPDIQSQTDLTVFTRIIPTGASGADAGTVYPRWCWGNAATNNRVLAAANSTGQLSGETWTGFFSDGTSRKLGSSTHVWTAEEDFTEVVYCGASGFGAWKDKGAMTLDKSFGSMTAGTACGPADTGYTTDNLFRDGNLFSDVAVSSRFFGHIVCRVAIKAALTTTQREAITDAVNALPTNISDEALVKFGYISDVHYSSTQPTYLNRFLEDGLLKLEEAVDYFNTVPDLDFVMINGDLIDHDWVDGSKALALADLEDVMALVSGLTAPAKLSFGNHDLDQMSKAEFVAATGMTDEYYAFNAGGMRVIVLDACYRTDSDSDPYDSGNYTSSSAYVNPAQRTWLASEVATETPILVITHQALSTGLVGTTLDIENKADVLAVLADGPVRVLINGHAHTNAVGLTDDIYTRSMQAATEGDYPENAYAVITIYRSGRVVVEGFGNQNSEA